MSRTSAPSLLPLLRSQTQADVLTRMLVGSPQPHTVQDLAAATGADGWSVRRELVRLERAGIVVRETVGRSLRFHLAEGSPLVDPLRTLIERSVGAEHMITEALAAIEGIDAAVLFGSWARGDVQASSDVDLLVVGDVEYDRLVDAFADVERRVGREIDLTAMTAEELAERRQEGSGFLRDVLDGPHSVLIGAIL